jgi:hypothetical protein
MVSDHPRGFALLAVKMEKRPLFTWRVAFTSALEFRIFLVSPVGLEPTTR